MAVEGAGAGPCRSQVPLCQRGALLLRPHGGRQRRLCPASRVTRTPTPSHGLSSSTTSSQRDILQIERKGLASLKRTIKPIYYIEKNCKRQKNLLMIPFRERSLFTGERGEKEKKNTTCTFILRVSMLLFDRMKSKNSFASRLGRQASALAESLVHGGAVENRDLFSVS